MTQNNYLDDWKFCKPEDWQEMVENWPDAASFMLERSEYREYLALKIDMERHDNRSDEWRAAYKRTMEIRGKQVDRTMFPKKPQPPMPAMEFTAADRAMEFLADLRPDERLEVLRLASEKIYDDAKTEGNYLAEDSLFARIDKFLMELSKESRNTRQYYIDGIPSQTFVSLVAARIASRDFLVSHTDVACVVVIDNIHNRPVGVMHREDKDADLYYWHEIGWQRGQDMRHL